MQLVQICNIKRQLSEIKLMLSLLLSDENTYCQDQDIENFNQPMLQSWKNLRQRSREDIRRSGSGGWCIRIIGRRHFPISSDKIAIVIWVGSCNLTQQLDHKKLRDSNFGDNISSGSFMREELRSGQGAHILQINFLWLFLRI